MSIVSIIVAVARDGAIGRGGDQPFYISGDLKRFKELTMGKPIIMGRNTFEALPRGQLPGRRNIVISSRPDYHIEGAEVVSSLDTALAAAADAPEVMIIGGGRVYAQALPVAHRLYLTEIDAEVPDADTHFPDIDPTKWSETSSTPWLTDPKAEVKYRYICLSRK